jgi:hypothetical protein
VAVDYFWIYFRIILWLYLPEKQGTWAHLLSTPVLIPPGANLFELGEK